MELAEDLPPVYKIDKDFLTKIEDLPTSADKAAALESMLVQELSEGDANLMYRQLGERLQRIKQRKDTSDEATERRLRELQEIGEEIVQTKEEPNRLNLQPDEYALFRVLRAHVSSQEETYLADCARRMVNHLRENQLLTPGWTNKRGKKDVEDSLLAESWNPPYAALGFDPANPPFLKPAVEALAAVES